MPSYLSPHGLVGAPDRIKYFMLLIFLYASTLILNNTNHNVSFILNSDSDYRPQTTSIYCVEQQIEHNLLQTTQIII